MRGSLVECIVSGQVSSGDLRSCDYDLTATEPRFWPPG